MTRKVSVHIQKWIEEIRATLQSPIGDRPFWNESWQNFLVMMVEAEPFTRPVAIAVGGVIHAECGPPCAIGASFT